MFLLQSMEIKWKAEEACLSLVLKYMIECTYIKFNLEAQLME